MSSSDRMIEEILDRLEPAFQVALTGTFSSNTDQYLEMASYHLGWTNHEGNQERGKRLRPLLCLLTYGCYQPDWTKAIPAGIALEFLHNFTLIHDDIQDNSLERHHRPTVWRVYGVPQAINAGDGLFALAEQSLTSLEDHYPLQTVLQVIRLFNQTVHAIIQGQVEDIAFEKLDAVSIDAYLQMIEWKTAALINACTKIGAILSTTDHDQINQAAVFGMNLGMAYQVQDDILGIWGDPTITGKPVGNDLLERKKSLPVIIGLGQLAEFSSRWSDAEPDPDRLIRLLDTTNIRSQCEQMAGKYTQKALQALETIGDSESEYWKALNQLTLRLLTREK